MIIDAFSHIMPRKFAKELFKQWPSPELLGLIRHAYFWNVEKRIRILDRLGIDLQVITLARPDIWLRIPPTLVIKLVKMANDNIAEIAERYKDRLIGVGTMPIISDESIDELRRCVEELGLKGMQIFSTNTWGQPVDHSNFTSFYKTVANIDVPLWLHPQTWQHHSWAHEYALDRIMGWLFETSLAMARFVFSRLFDSCPNIKIIVHHLGAMIPFIDERIKGFYEARKLYPYLQGTELQRPVLDYFKKFYADTVILSTSKHAFMCGYEFFGPDNLVFATDYPFGPEEGQYWARKLLDLIRSMNISEDDKSKILEKNSRILLKIL